MSGAECGEGKKLSRHNVLARLCLTMVKIGLIGFGGGSALIPVIEGATVGEKNLVSKEDYDVDVMVASITPGALPVEIAGAIGRRLAGAKGLLVGAASMALPGAALTILFLAMASMVSDELRRQISFVSVGISAFICCMLTEYISGTVTNMRVGGRLHQCVLVILAVIVLTCDKNLFKLFGVSMAPIFSVGTIPIFIMAFFAIFYTRCRLAPMNIATCAIICLMYIGCVSKAHIINDNNVKYVAEFFMMVLSVHGIREELKDGLYVASSPHIMRIVREGTIAVAVMMVCIGIVCAVLGSDVLRFAVNGIISSVMSFGGGDAYLAVADGLFVGSGIITEDYFYSFVVPTVNILPGSILCKTLSGIGYYVGSGNGLASGVILAALGFVISVVCSVSVVTFVYAGYEMFGTLNVFQKIKMWIRPIVSGLLINVMLSLALQAKRLDTAVSADGAILAICVAIYAASMYMGYVRKVGNGKIAMTSAVLALMMCNAVMM